MSKVACAVAILGAVLAGTATATADPGDGVKVVKQVWKKPGRNNIGLADITLANDNAFAVKDIKIKCVFTTVSTGRVTEIQQTLAGPVKPKAEQTFKKVSFGFVDTQAAEGACQVQSASQI